MSEEIAPYMPRRHYSLDEVLYTPEQQEKRDRESSIRFPSHVEKEEFWSDFPRNSWEFKCLVREGIYYRIELKQELPSYPPFAPRETYAGIPYLKFARIYEHWMKSPKNLAKEHPPTIFKALGEYRNDREKWEAETKPQRLEVQRILQEAQQLPTAPEGYHWHDSRPKSEWLGLYRNRDSKGDYRLWSICLGDPPGE
jgi:hypothetical protein